MIRGIPPRTMAHVSRDLVRTSVHRAAAAHAPHKASAAGPPVTPVNRPRQWRYQTRPSFKRVRGPLVDVFSEAEEVLIVVDLGGFTRGEISLSMTPEHYLIKAARGEQRFNEVIELPPNVDAQRSQERLVNGVLEIVLPRKKEAAAPAAPRRRTAKKR